MYDRNNGQRQVQVKKYTPDLKEDLMVFINDVNEYNLDNWSTFEKLKTDKITYFLAYYNGKIISINGCYNFRDNDWCLFTRQFTHPKYYNLLKRERHWASKSIPSRFLAKPSLEYCLSKNPDGIYMYTNTKLNDNENNWQNGNYPTRHTDYLIKLGVLEYEGIFDINYVKQDLFKVNVPVIKEVIGELLKQQIRYNDVN